MVTSAAVTAGSGDTTTIAAEVSYTFTGTRCGAIVRSVAAVASTTDSCVGCSVGMGQTVPLAPRRRAVALTGGELRLLAGVERGLDPAEQRHDVVSRQRRAPRPQAGVRDRAEPLGQ